VVASGNAIPARIRCRMNFAALERYTRRAAIANSRLIALNNGHVTFKVKDYRVDGPDRHKTMALDAAEFIRRFLIHVLPKGFHRIRHYGLFANGARTETIARARQLLAVVARRTIAISTAERTKLRTPVHPLCHAPVSAVA
jgi:hypothetical protein